MQQSRQAGQTLIILLVFMLVAISLTMAAAAVTIINIQTSNGYASGEQALVNAQSGIENALVRLERDPSYSGESMTFSGGGSATITISGAGPVTIVSVGAAGNFQRTATAVITRDANNVLTLSSWSETP